MVEGFQSLLGEARLAVPHENMSGYKNLYIDMFITGSLPKWGYIYIYMFVISFEFTDLDDLDTYYNILI